MLSWLTALIQTTEIFEFAQMWISSIHLNITDEISKNDANNFLEKNKFLIARWRDVGATNYTVIFTYCDADLIKMHVTFIDTNVSKTLRKFISFTDSAISCTK